MTTFAGITTRGGAVFAERPDWAGRGMNIFEYARANGPRKAYKERYAGPNPKGTSFCDQAQ